MRETSVCGLTGVSTITALSSLLSPNNEETAEYSEACVANEQEIVVANVPAVPLVRLPQDHAEVSTIESLGPLWIHALPY